MTDMVVVANTEKISKKEVRELEESLAAVGFVKVKVVACSWGMRAD